ncbi:hypothetical protein HPP92_005280 [Vanilla planifolia]|uniref:Clu domain-containing protein n=1 Tax=Vanilla planifolia TaxID=51239 RepID=A0A835RU45_VANPL|nr:hypothetical protein HPP92_005280 [Vanilla planifolia]
MSAKINDKIVHASNKNNSKEIGDENRSSNTRTRVPMAPKGGRNKSKAEKKKKDDKVLPVALDIIVKLPGECEVILKGISTDRIIDVRRLLCVNTVTCGVTSYSLSHEVRGPRLSNSVDVAGLKPCVLTLVEEDYDEKEATAHVRRLLDIVACVSFFGTAQKDASSLAPASSVSREGKRAAGACIGGGGAEMGVEKQNPSAKEASVDMEPEISGACPRLGSFYEFFSLAHLTPPVQFIRKTTRIRQEDQQPEKDHLFFLEIKLCNGKLVLVEACARGFYSVGKLRILCHDLIDLLRQLSRPFDKAYDDLMNAFLGRNKFGNLPYGYRANTWLVPPFAAQLPTTFPSLPAEDETWGGDGGGCGRNGSSDLIPWANYFRFIRMMPCTTAEERQIRDRNAFLLHSLFVDVAIFRAIAAVQHVIKKKCVKPSPAAGEILLQETVGDFSITVFQDASDASCKVDTKIDGSRVTGMNLKHLAERNLLKGITADENTVAHDVHNLGVVSIRYCGYFAFVKVDYPARCDAYTPLQTFDIVEQHEGGANALNINSLRMLLHKTPASEYKRTLNHSKTYKQEELSSAEVVVEEVLVKSLAVLENEDTDNSIFFRWELGACWIQHLQDKKNADKDKKQAGDKDRKHAVERGRGETKVEGLGKPLKMLRSSKKKQNLSEGICSTDGKTTSDTKTGFEFQNSKLVDSLGGMKAVENQCILKDLLPDPAFERLKESETGLHLKAPQELTEMALKYYDEVALPKLVADFGSLELSPVDGRTLTDFMHTRGLRMRSLGQIVKLSEKLSHVQSLCIHEMVVRAFKHILRAVIATASDTEDLALLIATTLNLLLGIHQTGETINGPKVHPLVWKWLEVFLKKRYGWELQVVNYNDVRKYAVLRGLCQKQVSCSSADGRQLLESSKTALDKGKLEDAVCYGTKALAKLIAVCGPYSRMTAGAYSLLAVVLYHTGDFNQATIYQQKALDINEGELGLDHPDTMKSYGDLAVFYYRLQHTELALKYVKRALYLLHLTCGPSHPNTAATYINVAMMEEGLGNVHVALRYLQKALKCNQRLLGPDHIQTAASYHAIAIALSLMEAYQLSVQHEQTTLKILRAKLGADDLRTQDAAAWLEYFESKAFEQQEAVRNGTKKPDASIASKGHLSVSDLLDYINPSQDRGRDMESMKRRNFSLKVKTQSSQHLNTLGLNGSSKIPESASENDIKQFNGPRYSEVEKQINCSHSKLSGEVNKVNLDIDNEADKRDSSYSESMHESSVFEENITAVLHSKLASEEEEDANILHKDGSGDIEDGWQPVQRPRSAGTGRQRLKQHGTSNGIRNNYQTEKAYAKQRYPYSSNRCYVLKKRTVVHGSYTDYYHSKTQFPSTRFGRKICKAVTYRIKSASSSINRATDSLPNVNEKTDPSVEVKDVVTSVDINNYKNPIDDVSESEKNVIVSLGTCPSYKDVALAPPGSVAKIQIKKDKEDAYLSKESSISKGEAEANDPLLAENHAEFSGAPSKMQKTAQEKVNCIQDQALNCKLIEKDSTSQQKESCMKDLIFSSEKEMAFTIRDENSQNNVEKESILEMLSSETEVVSSIAMPNNVVPGSIGSSNAIIELTGRSDLNVSTISTANSTEISVASVSEETSEKYIRNSLTISTDKDAAPNPKFPDDVQNVNPSGKAVDVDLQEISSSNVSDVRDSPNKKTSSLSASAVPFNPSTPAVLSSLPLNNSLPSSPIAAVAPWPLNVNLHPGASPIMPPAPTICCSPHHPYPSTNRPQVSCHLCHLFIHHIASLNH